MKGHYHLVLDREFDPDSDDCFATVNETDLGDAIEEAKQLGHPVTGYAFICTYGCGLYHDLLPSEVDRIKAAFPKDSPKQLTGQQ